MLLYQRLFGVPPYPKNFKIGKFREITIAFRSLSESLWGGGLFNFHITFLLKKIESLNNLTALQKIRINKNESTLIIAPYIITCLNLRFFLAIY